jgi:ribonuclease VapC
MILQTRLGNAGVHQLMLLISRAGVRVEAVDGEQAEIALYAYREFGKGRHPAGLTNGDCFSYALAAVRGESLLYKGEGFSRTDLF